MLKLGNTDINKGYLGNDEVNRAYLGGDIVLENRFISIWRTTTPNETITLPTPTNYRVDWGDGTITTDTNTHIYIVAGDYGVKINGIVTNFVFNDAGDKDKIISIENAGGLILGGDTFKGCFNLEYLKGKIRKPNASIGDCFFGCSVFNSDLLSLDTSDVNAITAVFREATLFNGDISNWDTSNAISLGSLFYQASSFNGDISSWDVSKVTSISTMMFRASSFNGDISSWNTENLVNCATAFQDAILFNSDIGGWDVSNVTQMQNMLRNTSFNYPLNLWDTSNVVNMSALFGLTVSFNQDISSWDFTSVRNMNGFMAGKGSEYDVNYMDNLYIKLDQDLNFSNMTNINLGFGSINYTSNGATARTSLINKGFIIQSGIQI